MLSRRQFTTGISGGIVIAAAAPGNATAAPNANLSRRAEVADLRAFAEKTHPRGREAAANAEWRNRWAALEASADQIPDGRYFLDLRRALGWFGDGHTTLLPFEFTGGVPTPLHAGPFGRLLAIQVRVFHDGAFVTAAADPNAAMLGGRVLQVGSMATEKLIQSVATNWPGNPAWAHRWAGLPFVSPALLQGLGAISNSSDSVLFTLATAAEGTRSLAIAPQRVPFKDRIEVKRMKSERESWAAAAGSGNYVKHLPERGAIYLSIDDMDNVEGKTFEQLTKDAFAALETAGPNRVVVDLRRNGGGNNYLGEPLRKRLGASRFNRNGGLYVLTGPQTFSAAQNLANRLERETFAMFVGDPTGGAPNHYGDAKTFEGKASGITAIVSSLAWFDSYPQDGRPWIMPDLPVPSTFGDWRAGRDPALDLALLHRPAGEVTELSRERIFYFRRASQSLEWHPFWV